ncbi:MAG: type II secretion system F family protein, partial [Thermoanaerobaculia bacterium]
LIQREVGGNLAEILDKISYTIRERFTLQRQIRVYTAQGRLTGYILAAMPILLGLAITALNPEYMAILFEEPMGKVLIAAAAILQFLGFLLIRRIIDIEI